MRKLGLLLLIISMNTQNSKAEASMPDSADVKLITHLADQVRSTYAPDKRSALFELKFDNNTAVIETTSPEAKQAFEQQFASSKSTYKVSFNVLPDATVGETKKAVVRLSVVDIRYTPANQAEMVTQALLGTPVDLLKKQGDYYLIRTPDGYIAWLKGASLKAMNEQEYTVWKASDKVMFTADYGHAYVNAEASSQRVSDLVMGNILSLKGKSGDYYQVLFPDGRSAYISAAQAVPYHEWLAKTELTAENVLKVAKSMIGVPYLWGGTSVKGVDCSGFTKTAYYMNGLVIPRDASQQVNSGKNIDILTHGEVDKAKVLANLKPADLLFFAERKGQVENARVTHVAIYIGNGEFIHASGLVRINSLFPEAENFDAHQARTIVSAKRYIGETETPGLDPLVKHPAYAPVN
jgi:cell wall-associated NlpC family hydrolase